MARMTKRKKKVSVEDRLAVLPTAEAAKEKISAATESALSSVASTVGPALEDAKNRLAPVAGQALAQGKRHGRRAAAKLGVAEEPKDSHKVRNLILMLGLGAVVAAVYKKVTGKDADPAWTSGRDTAAAAPPSPVAVASHDDPLEAGPVTEPPAGDSLSDPPSGAAGPVDGSEVAPTAPLASEETVESSVPTTPDEPLEKHDLT